MAAGVLTPDGLPRFVWADDKSDRTTYTRMLLRAYAERQRWRAVSNRKFGPAINFHRSVDWAHLVVTACPPVGFHFHDLRHTGATSRPRAERAHVS